MQHRGLHGTVHHDNDKRDHFALENKHQKHGSNNIKIDRDHAMNQWKQQRDGRTGTLLWEQQKVVLQAGIGTDKHEQHRGHIGDQDEQEQLDVPCQDHSRCIQRQSADILSGCRSEGFLKQTGGSSHYKKTGNKLEIEVTPVIRKQFAVLPSHRCVRETWNERQKRQICHKEQIWFPAGQRIGA